ncbi:MAG: YidC/Oxa1 family insertase periplasmic-domain containing protein [Aureliella sp.]
MDRRFFTWLMLTTALCFFYLSVRQQQLAKLKPDIAKVVAPNDDPLLRAPGAGPVDQPVDKLLAPNLAEAEANAGKTEPPTASPADAAGDAEATVEAAPGSDTTVPKDEEPQVAAQRPYFAPTAVTLGDPAKGYKLQVTLTSRGAGVEQTELIERTDKGKLRFRALEHDGGYLGYLGLAETITGLRIRTLPAGSPAATAEGIEGGLQVGDVLVELNGQQVVSPSGVEVILSQTKPGQEAELVIEREVDGKTQRLQAKVKLAEAPLDELRMYPGLSETVVGNLHRPGLMTTLGSIGGTQIPVGLYALPALQDTLDTDWETLPLEVDGGQGVEFRMPLDSFLANTGRPPQLDLVKRFRLYPASESNDGYVLDLETVVVNRNEVDVSLSLRQEGPAGLTLEGWWYTIKISPDMFAGAGQRDVIYKTEASSDQFIANTRAVIAKARKTEADLLAKYGATAAQTPVGMPEILLSDGEAVETRSLNYIGVDAPYFTAAILPHPQDEDALRSLRSAAAFSVTHSPERIDKAQLQATNTSFWFDTEEKLVPKGGEFSQRYQVFIGPKTHDALAAHGLDQAIEYGWFPWIAKPLSAILHFFHAIVGNYGLAIMMLTVLVRGSMFPLGRKAAINAQRMQELQPEMKRVNELYKDDLEKRGKAMQEIYAKHNFKPLAGCLPMFIQLPIFIGLYRCLSVDLSLRQQPLIPGIEWASNLAGPDQLVNWSSWMPEIIAGRGIGWLGPYFNILPMVTVGLFLLQQKMLMPKATDDQTRMTQNMMQIMTIFMGVMFFKVPSGLCIYFITSSIWSLVERKLVKRTMPSPKPGQPSPALALASDNGNSKEPARINPKDRRKGQAPAAKPLTRFEEMKRMLEKPAVKSATQRGSSKDKKRKR